MFNILVNINTHQIRDYNRDYTLFHNATIVAEDDHVLFVYSDLSSENCIVYQIEDSIENFAGNKYLYQNDEVSEDPTYVEPEEE